MKLESDISAIKECIKYIQRDVGEIKETLAKMDDRTTDNERDIEGIKKNFTLLGSAQAAFTVLVGFVSSYFFKK